MAKALIVHNPASGSLLNPGSEEHIRYYLESRGWDADLLSTPFSGEVFHSRLPGADLVLVAGGDGTLNRVVNLVINEKDPPPLAVIPLGTANDFAGSIGIDGVDRGLERALSGRPVEVDVGRIGEQYFINVAAGGFLCQVAHGTDRRLKKTLGRLAYYLKGLMEFSAIKPIELEVEEEGRRVFGGEAFLFMILNSPQAGNFPQLAPRASPRDGKMDLLLLKKCPAPELMGVVLKALSGRHIRDPQVLYIKGEAFSIRSPGSVVTDLDGEEGPPLPWEVEILPGRVRFLA